MTTNPSEPVTDAVNRTAQEILAALQAKDSAKVTSYYAPDAVIDARPPGGQGRRVGVQGHPQRYCGSQLQDESLKREDRGRRLR
jgi:hypothetical protein